MTGGNSCIPLIVPLKMGDAAERGKGLMRKLLAAMTQMMTSTTEPRVTWRKSRNQPSLYMMQSLYLGERHVPLLLGLSQLNPKALGQKHQNGNNPLAFYGVAASFSSQEYLFDASVRAAINSGIEDFRSVI